MNVGANADVNVVATAMMGANAKTDVNVIAVMNAVALNNCITP